MSFFVTFLVVLGILCALYALVSHIRVPADHGLVLKWNIPQIPIVTNFLALLGFPTGPMGDNQIVAREGQQGGWTAKHLPAGGHWVPFWRLFANKDVFPATVIAEDQVGEVTARDGALRPDGKNYPEPLADINFADGEDFLTRGGQRGIQLQTLGPGTQLINPRLFEVDVQPRTDVVPAIMPDDPYNRGHPTLDMWPRVGLVDMVIGNIIPESEKDRRILGKHVDGHDNFQRLDVFVNNGGEQGLQLDILEPGGARVNTAYVNVEQVPVTRVKPGWVIVQVSSEGDEPDPVTDLLNPRELDNRKPVNVLRAGVTGKRGYRQEILGPRDWFINPRRIKRVLIQTTPQTIRWHSEKHKGDDKPLGEFDPLPVESSESYQFSLLGALILRVLDADAPMMAALVGGGVEELKKEIASITARVVHQACSRHGILDFIHDKGRGVAEKITAKLRKRLYPYYVTVEGFEILDLDYTSRGDQKLAKFLEQLKEQAEAPQRQLAHMAGIPAEEARKKHEKARGEAEAEAPAQIIKRTAEVEAEASMTRALAASEVVDLLIPNKDVQSGVGALIAAADSISTVVRGPKK